MLNRRATLALHVLVAIAAIAHPGAAQAPGTSARPAASTAAPAVDLRAEAQAIRARSQSWLAAERNKDVAGIMAHFATDAVAIYGGRVASGSAAIRRYQEEKFASLAKERPGYSASWQATTVDLAQAGDMAYESGTFDDSWNGGKDRERGHYLTVWRKVGGEWKAVRDIAVPEAKPSPAKPPAP